MRELMKHQLIKKPEITLVQVQEWNTPEKQLIVYDTMYGVLNIQY
jgi:hypothetical protein